MTCLGNAAAMCYLLKTCNFKLAFKWLILCLAIFGCFANCL